MVQAAAVLNTSWSSITSITRTTICINAATSDNHDSLSFTIALRHIYQSYGSCKRQQARKQCLDLTCDLWYESLYHDDPHASCREPYKVSRVFVRCIYLYNSGAIPLFASPCISLSWFIIEKGPYKINCMVLNSLKYYPLKRTNQFTTVSRCASLGTRSDCPGFIRSDRQ